MNFPILSYVQWTASDKDVPRGAVGKVLGAVPRVAVDGVCWMYRVEFPNGTWTFDPSQLRMTSAPAAQRIYINEPAVYTANGTGKKGLVEPYLGQAFKKFNSNTGWTYDGDWRWRW